MGHNATVVILSDSLDDIRNDNNFGSKLATAIDEIHFSGGHPVGISTEHYATAALVIEEHHSNDTGVLLVGGNSGTIVGLTEGNYSHASREEQKKHIIKVARHIGITVSDLLGKNS